MKITIIALLVLIVASGCAGMRPHSSEENKWRLWALGSFMADLVTTEIALEEGCREIHPVSNEAGVVEAKVLSLVLTLAAGYVWPERRVGIYKTIAGLNGVITVWNVSQIIEVKL